MSCNAVLGYATFPNAEVARTICETLVREGAVTCVNIFAPHVAIYEWVGEMKSEREVGVLLKTDSDRQAAVIERLNGLHPYDTPALVFVNVAAGGADFLRWLGARS